MERTSIFVDRQSLLETLSQHNSVLLLGLHGVGKTALIHHYLGQVDREDPRGIGVYIHLQSTIASPIAFARHYIGRVVMSFCRRRGIQTDRINYLRGDLPLAESAGLGSRSLLRVLSLLSDEEAKKEPDQRRVLAAAFELPHELAREQAVRFVISLDEFQELLKLNNFRAVPDILTILREAIEGRGGVSYLLSGSAVTILKRLFVDEATPFFSQFRTLYLLPLETEGVIALADRIAEVYGIRSSREVGQEVGRLTGGYPAYILPMVNRACRDTLTSGEAMLASETIGRAFVEEMFEPGGGVAESCNYLYQSALDRVRGGVLLQEILRMLAIDDGLILAHIARRLDKPNGEVANYCRALVESDLIVQNGRRFSISTPVLRCWLAGTALGFDGPGRDTTEILETLTPYTVSGPEAVPAGLRITDEEQVKDLFYNFTGQRVDGRFFGQRGDVTLPVFDRIGRFTTRDGWAALDMTTESGEQWLAQISWEEKRCGRERIIEMAERLSKLRLTQAIAWYIARGGFTKEAMDAAREQGIRVSSIEDLERIASISV